MLSHLTTSLCIFQLMVKCEEYNYLRRNDFHCTDCIFHIYFLYEIICFFQIRFWGTKQKSYYTFSRISKLPFTFDKMLWQCCRKQFLRVCASKNKRGKYCFCIKTCLVWPKDIEYRFCCIKYNIWVKQICSLVTKLQMQSWIIFRGSCTFYATKIFPLKLIFH